MVDDRFLCAGWQSLLKSYGQAFTRPGWRRFSQWVTGMVLCQEDHMLTRTLLASDSADQWSAQERFAGRGKWDRIAVEKETVRLIERERPVCWHGYRPVALDDTKSHGASKKVWGVCTFREYASRSPNRARIVRAHNWVVLGDLIPDQPWWYLPHSGRVYFREGQLPEGEELRTKLELGIEMLRQADAVSATPLLAIFDGANATKPIVGGCLNHKGDARRIEVLTRLRKDARLYAPLPEPTRGRCGRPRKWGDRLPSPCDYAEWDVAWEEGEVVVYGRTRRFRSKRLECRWAVSGADHPVSALALEVEGSSKSWFLVTSACELTTAHLVEAYAARYRQEDGFRDHKQLLGMEECRAWTKEPILRTFQVQMVAMTLLRLIQFRLDILGEWWESTPWYPQKRHASILDLRRLVWKRRREFSHLLSQTHDMQKTHHDRQNLRPQEITAA